MPQRRTDSNRRRPGRNFAAWLLMVLPGFMFLGMLAPAAVSVKPKAEETYAEISFRHFAPRRPIQIPPVVADAMQGSVEPVFSGARYVADQARRVFEFDAITDGGRGEIVLAAEASEKDGSESFVSETVFDSSLDQTQLVVDLNQLWDPSVFDVVPGLVVRDGFSQWDDFHGTAGSLLLLGPPTPPVVVPEPATAALLAVGLSALALRRKRA